MSKKLMILLRVVRVNICILSAFILTSCCCFKQDQDLTDFPPRPELIDYNTDPVLSYNKSNKTYIVTSTFLENSVLNVIFVDEIIKWKRENGVK